MNKLNCFKAYDIRGRLDEEINEEIAWRIGRAYGEYLKPETIVLGGDVRLSSEKLKLALSMVLEMLVLIYWILACLVRRRFTLPLSTLVWMAASKLPPVIIQWTTMA